MTAGHQRMVNGRENGSNHRGADRSAALGLLILLCAFFIFLGMPAGNADPFDAEETEEAEEAHGDAVEDAVQTFLNGYRYSQVHTVPHYRKRNQVMSATYFDGRALALGERWRWMAPGDCRTSAFPDLRSGSI